MEKRLDAGVVCVNFMKSKLLEYKKLLNNFDGLLNSQPLFSDDDSEHKWTTDFDKFKKILSSKLDPKICPRFNQINFDVYEQIEPNSGYVFTGLTTQTINRVKAILEDEIFFLTKNKKETEINMQKRKLLEARRETLDFEENLAEIICGDNLNFPYRSSWYLTKFFQENGFNYQHDGTTRSRWVSSVLFELNIDEIYSVTQAVFKRKYFVKHCQEREIDLDECINNARDEFSVFLENSIKSNEIVDLSPAYKLNVNFDLLSNKIAKTKDISFNKMVEDARNFYIEGNKQIAIEKLWDAFERLKTIIKPSDKKTSANNLIHLLSQEMNSEIFEGEFKTLTTIGNNYMIRHSEVGKIPINDDKTKDYLFFRMLSLIDLCISKL